MQVKVCPKCGSENRVDKASCSGCYASLESVSPTEAKEKPAPVQTQPRTQQPPAAQPLSSPGPSAANDGPPAPNYGPPSTTYGPSFNERRSAPVKRGPNWGAIVFVILLLGGAGFGGWWFFLKPASPESVVQKFVDASKAGDFDKMKACLCQSMVRMIESTPGAEQQAKQRLTSGGSSQFDGKITGVICDQSNPDLAYVSFEPVTANPNLPGTKSIEIVCCKEDGAWKIDLNATAMRAMAKARGK